MRVRTIKATFIVVLLLLPAATAFGDSYSTFETTRFSSANGRYFIEVTPDKRATLYRKGRRLAKLWSRVLPELPARMFVTNDGTRAVMIDYYYGNNRSATKNVVLFFDRFGNQIAGHALGQVANLSRVLATTSSAHWFYGASYTPDQSTLIVETIVRKCDPANWTVQRTEDIAAFNECMKAVPFEELRFSMATGSLISRVDIQSKYSDRETRLLHELELAENDRPRDNLNFVYALLELARFYDEQKRFARAKPFYDRAIPIYGRILFPSDTSVALAIGDAATNCRELRDYGCAQKLYRRALTSLDGKQGHPDSVSPAAIKVYEEYAVLLRELKRDEEASRMERRANLLRGAYPDFQKDKTSHYE